LHRCRHLGTDGIRRWRDRFAAREVRPGPHRPKRRRAPRRNPCRRQRKQHGHGQGGPEMKETISHYELILATAPRKLVEIPEADATYKSTPEKWSKKEIIGHLIDSAGNNHQRFVRCQHSPRIEFPEYDQNPWVASQAYATE